MLLAYPCFWAVSSFYCEYAPIPLALLRARTRRLARSFRLTRVQIRPSDSDMHSQNLLSSRGQALSVGFRKGYGDESDSMHHRARLCNHIGSFYGRFPG